MPYGYLCELRCKPGYKNTGPTYSKCWNGGFVKGYKEQICVKKLDSEITDEEKAFIAGEKPQEIIFTEVRPKCCRFLFFFCCKIFCAFKKIGVFFRLVFRMNQKLKYFCKNAFCIKKKFFRKCFFYKIKKLLIFSLPRSPR